MTRTRLERYQAVSPYGAMMWEGVHLYEDGYSIRKVAESLGMTYGSARTMLINGGVVLRSPGNGKPKK